MGANSSAIPRSTARPAGLTHFRCMVPRIGAALLAGLALLAACADAPAPDGGSAAELESIVLTTFQPSRWMAERLLDGAVPVECILPADADAAHWQPPRDVLARLQRARLVVLHGAGLETWADTANLAPSRSVDLSAALSDSFLEPAGEDTHSHGMTGQHSHAGTDPHLWLEPSLAGVQAQTLHAALARAFPEHAASLDANLASLVFELGQLAADWSARAPALRAACLFAAHPAYDYLAAAHGFEITSLDLDPQTTSGEQAVTALREAGAGPGCLLLWESAPRAETAQALRAQLDMHSLVIDPGEGVRPSSGQDVLAVWRANLQRLDEALAKTP